MNAEVIDIGRYIKIPYDLLISKISHRAFRVWALIAAGASPENPIASVNQRALAEQLSCSTDTIGRAIAELIRHRLLSEAGKWNQGRCKSYRLNWNLTMSKDETKPEGLDDVLAEHGESWKQEYACFDGVSGRPSLRECVEEALKHSSKTKSADLKIFIDGWLRIASHRWSESKAPPPVEEVVQVTDESCKIDDEREWIIAQIKIDNERQRRKDALEARRQASFGGRGAALANKASEPVADLPICRENYPFSWEFHRIKWSEMRRNLAA
jgi:hypothetical protein